MKQYLNRETTGLILLGLATRIKELQLTKERADLEIAKLEDLTRRYMANGQPSPATPTPKVVARPVAKLGPSKRRPRVRRRTEEQIAQEVNRVRALLTTQPKTTGLLRREAHVMGNWLGTLHRVKALPGVVVEGTTGNMTLRLS